MIYTKPIVILSRWFTAHQVTVPAHKILHERKCNVGSDSSVQMLFGNLMKATCGPGRPHPVRFPGRGSLTHWRLSRSRRGNNPRQWSEGKIGGETKKRSRHLQFPRSGRAALQISRTLQEVYRIFDQRANCHNADWQFHCMPLTSAGKWAQTRGRRPLAAWRVALQFQINSTPIASSRRS